MIDKKEYYIGIDLGGTFIKGGIVDKSGEIIVCDKVPTESDKGAEAVADNVSFLVNLLIAGAKTDANRIFGIGMGVPGVVDSEKGRVAYCANLNWIDVGIAEKIEKRTGFSVKIANDANVAALGEARYGVGREYHDFVFLTLGTGVGGGIIINKKLYEGNRSAGAEIGHMVIEDGGEECTCGRRGCFEAYASATALIRETKKAMISHRDSKMWELGTTEKINGKTAFDYADSDPYAKEVVNAYIEKLACGIVNIANIFRPEAVIIGGGVCEQGDVLIKPVQKALDKEVFGNKYGPRCVVRTAELGNRAGILGAAALIER